MIIDAFRTAVPDDAGVIVRLVNAAYRPQTEHRGWTHEADLVEGARVSPVQVLAAVTDAASVVLLGLAASHVVACVQLEPRGSDCHLGMLAVEPVLQGRGLGKQMLERAERHACEHLAARRLLLSVLSAREELIAFYLRQGYRRTGLTREYPVSAGVGTPRGDGLEVEVLEKCASALSSSRGREAV